jgi:hypothetical protein
METVEAADFAVELAVAAEPVAEATIPLAPVVLAADEVPVAAEEPEVVVAIAGSNVSRFRHRARHNVQIVTPCARQVDEYASIAAARFEPEHDAVILLAS